MQVYIILVGFSMTNDDEQDNGDLTSPHHGDVDHGDLDHGDLDHGDFEYGDHGDLNHSESRPW